MVIELRVMQFWSEIILVISNQTRAARSFDFEITHMISDQISLNSVQLPLFIVTFQRKNKIFLTGMRASSLAGLRGSRGVGGGGEGKRELAIMSHDFEYLRPKSGREMLIGRFDQVMTYYILSRT